MTQTFDPHYKWLAIPPDKRPPNCYQLLGVQELEQDVDVLLNAADARMAHVKSFANGPYADLSQELLNELSHAKLVLCDPARKSKYDAQLTAKNAPTAPMAVPLGVPTPAATPITKSSTSPEIRVAAPSIRSRRKRSGVPIIFTALVVMGIILAGLVLWVVKSKRDEIASAKSNLTSSAPGTTHSGKDAPTPDPSTAAEILNDSPKSADPHSAATPNVGTDVGTNEAPAENPNAGLHSRNPSSSRQPIPGSNGRPRSSPNMTPSANNTSLGATGTESTSLDLGQLPVAAIGSLTSAFDALVKHDFSTFFEHRSTAQRFIAASKDSPAASHHLTVLDNIREDYQRVWTEVQKTLIVLQPASDLVAENGARASVVEASSSKLTLFVSGKRRSYAGQPSEATIVFPNMPLQLVLLLADMAGNATRETQRAVAYARALDSQDLPTAVGERWIFVARLWERFDSVEDPASLMTTLPTLPRDGVVFSPSTAPAQQLKSPNIRTCTFDLSRSKPLENEFRSPELSSPDAYRMEVVKIYLGKRRGNYDIAPDDRRIEFGKTWKLSGIEGIPVQLRLILRESEGNISASTSAVYRLLTGKRKEIRLSLSDLKNRLGRMSSTVGRKKKQLIPVETERRQLAADILATERRMSTAIMTKTQFNRYKATMMVEKTRLARLALTIQEAGNFIEDGNAQIQSFERIDVFARDLQENGWLQIEWVPIESSDSGD